MFTKILKSDIKSGTLVKWNVYLVTILLFSAFSLLCYLERRAIEFVSPELASAPSTLGDYLFFVFSGSSTGEFDNAGIVGGLIHGRINIQMPTTWMIFMLWVLFTTLYYPYHELMGIGKHMLILTKQKVIWWTSKCVWVMINAISHIYIAVLSVSVSAICFGATLDLSVSPYLVYNTVSDFSKMQIEPWNMLHTLLLLAPIGAALSVLQLFFSLVFSPIYGYILMIGYVLLSSYISSPIFICNYSAAARSIDFVINGMRFENGIVTAVFAISTAMLIGYLIFSRIDILNKE